jgi:uncharacterized membrane protein (Fun14 family)
MSNIPIDTNSLIPLAATAGFGGIVGFLTGFALKQIIKILAVIAGLFFAAILYFQTQSIININWNRLQTLTNSTLSSLSNSITTVTTGNGVNNSSSSPSILSHLNLPLIGNLDNLGLPLTGSAAAGFVIGFMKG